MLYMQINICNLHGLLFACCTICSVVVVGCRKCLSNDEL